MRPFLKWAGGKYRLRDRIKEALPSGKRLIEPFAGSCAIFLNTNYKNYLLADKNPDLINLYLHIQQEGKDFIRYCQKFFTPKNNTKKRFYQLREQFNKTNDIALKSALFLYLNRHGYNGLCRYNSNNEYNVPFGCYTSTYFPEREMLFFHEKSRHAIFKCADFVTTMKNCKQHDVIYCDPPYVQLSMTANFTQYHSSRFDQEQQVLLASLAKKLARKNISVVISNHDTVWIREIYADATITTFTASRSISCIGDKRKQVNEVLAIYIATSPLIAG